MDVCIQVRINHQTRGCRIFLFYNLLFDNCVLATHETIKYRKVIKEKNTSVCVCVYIYIYIYIGGTEFGLLYSKLVNWALSVRKQAP